MNNYFIEKAKEFQEIDYNVAKAWLLTGKSIEPRNFNIQYQTYMLEKSAQDVKACAEILESMYRRFPNNLSEEVSLISNAVRICNKVAKEKETEEHEFLVDIFSSLSKATQMDILLQQSNITSNQYEKCQYMLLLVKLFPDTIPQHGPGLLFNLLSYESDPYSTFRKLVVVELVPAVLQLFKNMGSSPRLIPLLKLCIEYYVLVPNYEEIGDRYARWEKLFWIVDQLGVMLGWTITPFFTGSGQMGGSSALEAHYNNLERALAHRANYTPIELASIAVVLFLVSIVNYSELSRTDNGKFGEPGRLMMVEVFTPRWRGNGNDKSPPLTTVSSCGNSGGRQGNLVHFFLTAAKMWDLINSMKGEILEKEFFILLYSLKWIQVDEWGPFQNFTLDYRTYTGQHFPPDPQLIHDNVKLASFHCATNNFKGAVEYGLKAIGELAITDISNGESNKIGREEFSFFNLESSEGSGRNQGRRRVHFISDQKSEIIAYIVNVLIHCFHECVEEGSRYEDQLLGHLLVLIQMEWPSPPAEKIFLYIFERIKENGGFKYFPFFQDFVIEPDILEEFMAMVNQNGKINLDIFPNSNGTSSGGRRMATRGVDKGAKNDFKTQMRTQIMRRDPLENLILKFLTLNKNELISCF